MRKILLQIARTGIISEPAPALEHAVIGNIVPDFPLINKSFNLSYAGVDL